MDIHIFSDDNKVSSAFSSIGKSRNFSIHIHPVADCKDVIRNLSNNELIYVDIQNYSDNSEIRRNLNFIAKYKKIRCGIIDVNSRVTGITHYLHGGFYDYLNSADITAGITAKRINEISDYKPPETPNTEHLSQIAQNNQANTLSWEKINEGKEYIFFLMYIRLDRQKKLKTEFGYDFIEKLTEKFEKYIEHFASANNGKLWNWDVNNGIILFPYSDNISAITVAAFRFMRDSILLACEVLNAPVKLDFTLIMDKGTLEYHSRGMTGTTISESLNRIYHAADLMAESGNLYIFDSLFSGIPEQITDYFLPCSDFEGHSLKKLRKVNIRK